MSDIKEFPDKILLIKDNIIEDYWVLKNLTQCEDAEYIRKDIVDEILAIAEDHAYLAGSEAMRNKAVKWLEDELCAEKVNTLYPPMSIVISKSYESVDEFIQGFKKIN